MKNNKILVSIFAFLIIFPFLFGMFYDFVVLFSGIILTIILLSLYVKNKRIKLYLNYSFILTLVFFIFNILSCFWAVDTISGIFGTLRSLAILLFVIILMQLEKDEKQRLWIAIPISSLLMLFSSLIVYFIPNARNIVFSSSNRLTGFFQYANTFALYLLISIVIVAFKDWKMKFKIPIMFALLIGILLTGSRIVFVITTFVFILFSIMKTSGKRKYYAITYLSVILISFVVVLITNNVSTIGRYLTISGKSSTLLGRILYYKDSLKLIISNIFGYGYMGYSYLYKGVQTGAYSIRFVHNEYLQILLDIGIIPLIVFVGILIKSIFSKDINKMSKIIIFIISVHIFLDFDLQFAIIWFILFLSIGTNKVGEKEVQIPKAITIYTVYIIMILLFGYYALASFSNFLHKDNFSLRLLSNYTDAKINKMLSLKDIEEANNLANKILEKNSEIASCYEVKATYELSQGNFEKMSEFEEQAINLEKYNISMYEEYIFMLNEIANLYSQNNDSENTEKYIKKIINVEKIFNDNKEKMDKLFYELDDYKKYKLNDKLQKYINNLKNTIE